MRYREPRLPSDIETELQGMDWHWVMGSKHWKLMIGGHLVGIWPRGAGGRQTTDRRPNSNIRAQIRRFRREKAA